MKMQAFQTAGRAGHGAARQDFIPGLCLLTGLTASEVGEALPAAQARGFYLAIGRRLAALEPLDGVSDVAGLCARANAFWQALGWGEIDIEAGDHAIIVRHNQPPIGVPGCDGPHWRAALSALLEGAWDAWFRTLGSGPALVTTGQWQGECLELRHGR